MSKAFTRESDDVVVDEIPSTRFRPTGRSYLTKAGADRLRSRLSTLREERRILGDKTENLNSSPALKRIEFECQKLQLILESAVIVEPPSDPEKIALGAWVQLRDGDGAEETFQIVGVEEADPDEGRISSASPLARALLNRRMGEKVQFKIPTGQRELTILSVRYESR